MKRRREPTGQHPDYEVGPDFKPPTMALDALEAEADEPVTQEIRKFLLTDTEQLVVQRAAELYNLICEAVPEGPNRARDIAELVPHIHAIQRTFMAQAAARAFPEIYRAMGESRVVRPDPLETERSKGGPA